MEDKYFLSVETFGNNEIITTTEGASYTLPTEIVDEITKYTNDKEETLSLVAYLKDRYDSCGSERVNLSPNFIATLSISLLATGIPYDKIIIGLDNMKDYELFSPRGKARDESLVRQAVIADVVARVNYELQTTLVEPEYKDGYDMTDEEFEEYCRNLEAENAKKGLK